MLLSYLCTACTYVIKDSHLDLVTGVSRLIELLIQDDNMKTGRMKIINF